MRDAVKKLGGDPENINPICPADLVIDHSVQVEFSRTLVLYLCYLVLELMCPLFFLFLFVSLLLNFFVSSFICMHYIC